MAALANKAQTQYPIRNLATRITHDVPSKQFTAEIAALYRWVRDHIRYRFDPRGVEWLQSPARTVKERAGDCDDIATLLAALIGSLGHPWRFRTVGASKNVQQHVGVQAWDRKRWIDVDPVLEPPQVTTSPRPELGTFAAFAPGAERIFNSEGRMLSGPVSPAQRTLWTFVPYFPSVPPRGGDQPPMVQYPVTDPRYGSPNRPGYVRGKPMTVVLGPNRIDERYADAMGWVEVNDPGLGFGFLKAIGKAVGGVVSAVVPGGSAIVGAVNAVGDAIGGGKKKKKGAPAPVQNVPAAPMMMPGVAEVPIALERMRADMRALPSRADLDRLANTAKRTDVFALMQAVRAQTERAVLAREGAAKTEKRAAELVARRKRMKAKAEARKKKHKARKEAKKKKAKAKSMSGLGAAKKKDRKKPDPALRHKLKKKHGSRIRMRYDRDAHLFRVYKPRKKKKPKMAGPLGAIVPNFVVNLGALTQREAASAAVAAVKTFITRNGTQPRIKLPAVQAFQETDPQLANDGLWGLNTRTAAAYYLGVAPSSLPRGAPGFERGPLTWKEPAAKPTTTPANLVIVDEPSEVIVVRDPETGEKKAVKVKRKRPKGEKIPGWKEVEATRQNPGLTPIGAPTTKTQEAAQAVAVVKEKKQKQEKRKRTKKQQAEAGVAPLPTPEADVAEEAEIAESASAAALAIKAAEAAEAAAESASTEADIAEEESDRSAKAANASAKAAKAAQQQQTKKKKKKHPVRGATPSGGVQRIPVSAPPPEKDNTLLWMAFLYWLKKKAA